MTIALRDACIRLIGSCPADDGERLLQLLLTNPEAEIDWSGCESAHATVIQVLLAAKRPLKGPPASVFLDRFIAPVIIQKGEEV